MAKNQKKRVQRKIVAKPAARGKQRRSSALVRTVYPWSAAPMAAPAGLTKMGIPDRHYFTESMAITIVAQHGVTRVGTSEILPSAFPRWSVLNRLYASKMLCGLKVTFIPYSGLAHGGSLGLFLDPAFDTGIWVSTPAQWLTNYGAGQRRGSTTLALSMPRQHTMAFELPNTAKLANPCEEDKFGEAAIGVKWISYGYEDSSEEAVPIGNLVVTASFRFDGLKPVLDAGQVAPAVSVGEQQ